MPVYLPTAIVGNSRVLATLGASGELMTFFYPRLDWAQNVHEALVYVVLQSRAGHFQHWTFEHAFTRRQEYLPEATVVSTFLTHSPTGVTLTLTDWIPPDTSCFMRRFEAANPTSHPVQVRVYQYMDLNLGEVAFRNAVRYVHDESAIVQQWHAFCFVIGGDPFDEWQCGKADAAAFSNAKNDMMDGRLQGQALDIGDVNFTIGWHTRLSPATTLARHLCIVPGKDEVSARQQLNTIRHAGYPASLTTTLTAHHCYLPSRKVSVAAVSSLPNDLRAAYEMSLRVLPLLFDRTSGACLAAPEFDPCFVQSGGYGYCWPRDGAAAVLALHRAGLREYAEPFFGWCRRSQATEGFWHQRYWLSGDVGPSWCTPDVAIQIDQTGSVLHAMSVYWEQRDGAERISFAREYWDVVHRGADYLLSMLTPEGLHRTAFDLWETFRGTFLYSNAAIYAALRGAALIASFLSELDSATRWADGARRVKQACLQQLWNGTRFLRGLTERGDPDETMDSSVLGALVPFELIDLSNQTEKEMLVSTLDIARERLEVTVPGVRFPHDGHGIRRYENDSYAGGPAAAVNTLWMALTLLRIAQCESPIGAGSNPVCSYSDLAVHYMRTCLSRTTPTGLLPELMGGPDGAPYWAAPHAWCTGWFIECCLALQHVCQKSAGQGSNEVNDSEERASSG